MIPLFLLNLEDSVLFFFSSWFMCNVGDGSLNTKLCLILLNPWTVAFQTSLSRQEYWSGLPFLSPGTLSDPGI